MANYQKVKGTQDFYGEGARKMHYIEDYASKVLNLFGCSPLITPIFENSEVFIKNIGEESDVVSKEMYTFKDKGDRSITLRPEGTAAVARFFIENKLYANPNLNKFYYYGPMFRYERPQVGRFREFNQFGIEMYGTSSYLLDADVINSAYLIFKGLGVKNIKLKLNSIGDFASRAAYSKALKEYFRPVVHELCDDCKRRLETNPMRILDCKVDKCHPSFDNAPKVKDYLSEEAKAYFNRLCNTIEALNIPYEIDDNLVRGLDYYTDTVFEFIISSDDELNGLAICAGGKYASMIESMCGVDVPGIGYAFGIERLVSVMEAQGLWDGLLDNNDTEVVVFGLDDESKTLALKETNYLRENGIRCEIEYKSNSMKSQFKLAERVNARFIVIIGENERLKHRNKLNEVIY